MKLKNIANLLLFFVALVMGSCNVDEIPFEIIEEYNLTVSPLSHAFTADGGELHLDISASKTTSKVSGGKVQEKSVEQVAYTVSVSGKGFSVVEDKIIAKKNEGAERSGTITITIEGTNQKETVAVTQESTDKSEDEEKEDRGYNNLKVLAIGNSYSVDAVEQYLYEIADYQGDTIIIGNMYIGSSNLELHYNNSLINASAYQYRKIVDGQLINRATTTLAYALDDEEWDIVTLQQSSPYSGLPNSYSPYLDNLISYVKSKTSNPNLKIAFHMTWAWANGYGHGGYTAYNKDQLTMYNAIVSTMQSVVSPKVDFIIPSGTAIQNGRTSSLGDSFNRDGTHLEYNYGRFTVALTWYEKLFGKSALKVKYAPDNLTAFQTEVAQHAAHHAVKDPYNVTSFAHLVDSNPPPAPSHTISFVTGKDIGAAIRIRINAAEADQPYVWIDLNNNNIKDYGETVSTFGTSADADIQYTVGSQTIDIHGKVSYISMNNQGVKSIDVSKNTDYLTNLNVPFNDLTEIDLSRNRSLEILQVGANSLTELDVSNNANLYQIYCNTNKLQSLKIPVQSERLNRINIVRNQMSAAALTEIMEALPNRNEAIAGNFYIIDQRYLAPEGDGSEANEVTPYHYTIAADKNWNMFYDY